MRLLGVMAFVGSVLFWSCSGGDASPTAPGNPAPPPSSVAQAVVGLSGLTVAVVAPRRPGDPYVYEEHFLISETGRKSGAFIENIESRVDNGDSDNTGPGCLHGEMRVEPGGTFDTASMGYCAPIASSRTPTTRIDLLVAFSDDSGARGTAQATVRP